MTMQRSVSGDSTIYTLSVDSVAKRVEGGWLFDAASPVSPPLKIAWNKRGFPLDDSIDMGEPAAQSDPRTRLLMNAPLGILAMVPPNLRERTVPSVWADTIDLGGLDLSKLVNDTSVNASLRVVRTWRLWSGDTLAVEFGMTLVQQSHRNAGDGTEVATGVTYRKEMAFLVSLDEKREIRGGIAIIRSGVSSRTRVGSMNVGDTSVTTEIGRLVLSRKD